jgi:hypothetical protein
MLISTLLYLALGAPAVQGPVTTTPAPSARLRSSQVPGARKPRTTWQAPPLPTRGIYGERLPTSNGGQIGAVFGGTPTRIGGPMASITGMLSHSVMQISFNDPAGTGWNESAILGIPAMPIANPPLLVMFHSYNVSEWDCYLNTPIFKLALERGWYVIAPLGAHQVNFSIPYSQANIEAVLDWTMMTFPVDPNRIYGVGFSMGGGGVTSYMARHLDPAHPRFAAVVHHTGGVSIANTHENTVNPSVLEDASMFGGPPSLVPFKYAQASVMDIDGATGTINAATDMARNVAHIPLRSFTIASEPAATAYLRTQTLALFNWMLGFSSNGNWQEIAGNTHEWIHLDPVTTIEFLRQQTLTMPRAGTHRVLADREGTWHHFYIEQDAPGAFTPFRWTMLDSLNRVVIDQTENLKRIVIDSASLGLHTQVVTEVVIGTSDGLPEEVTLSGYPTPPTSVSRGPQTTAAWSWNAVTEAVTLQEANASGYPLWTITP